MQNKVIIAGVLIVVFAGVLFLAGHTAKNRPATDSSGNAAAYANLKEISKYKTAYLGDASKDGAIIAYLPQLSNFYKQNMFSLQTDEVPYAMTIYYERDDQYDSDEDNLFMTSCAENNALILFTFIDNLDIVSYAYRETPSNGQLIEDEYETRYTYERKDFVSKYGDFALLAGNLEQLNKTLKDNLVLDGGRLHQNRVILGSGLEHIEYRNGEPDELIENPDGSRELFYKNLGALYSMPDFALAVPGSEVRLYLDSPVAIQREGLHGVFKISVRGWSEIIYNLNIREGTYEEILKKLGEPTVTEQTEDGGIRLTYLLKNAGNHCVYFIIKDEKVLEHGLDIDYDIDYNIREHS